MVDLTNFSFAIDEVPLTKTLNYLVKTTMEDKLRMSLSNEESKLLQSEYWKKVVRGLLIEVRRYKVVNKKHFLVCYLTHYASTGNPIRMDVPDVEGIKDIHELQRMIVNHFLDKHLKRCLLTIASRGDIFNPKLYKDKEDMSGRFKLMKLRANCTVKDLYLKCDETLIKRTIFEWLENSSMRAYPGKTVSETDILRVMDRFNVKFKLNKWKENYGYIGWLHYGFVFSNKAIRKEHYFDDIDYPDSFIESAFNKVSEESKLPYLLLSYICTKPALMYAMKKELYAMIDEKEIELSKKYA